MFLKDILDKNMVINCRTEEEATKLFKYAEENGYDNYKRYSNKKIHYDYLQDTCYRYTTQFDEKGILEYGDKHIYLARGYKIITLDDLDDFHIKEKEMTRNTIRRVRREDGSIENDNFANGGILNTKDAENIFKQINRMKNNFSSNYEIFFTINRKKKTLFLNHYTKKITIKCHETDKFDWKIGLGLALSKANAINNKRAYFLRDIMRNSKTHKLDYKKYSNFVLNEYFNYDSNEIKKLDKKVNETDDNIKIHL